MPRPKPINVGAEMRRTTARGPTGLAELENLGPKSAAWLDAAGIRSRDDIRRLGVIEVCRRLRRAGRPVTVVMAYALEGALAGCHWQRIPAETRQWLRTEFARMKRETPAV